MDTKIQSALRGRIGASILAIVSAACITLGISPAEQEAAQVLTNEVFQWIGGGSGLGAAILAFVSKMRE